MATVAIQTPSTPVRLDPDGSILIGNSTLACDSILHDFLQGDSPEAIASSYPSITLQEVYATIAYYLEHRNEFDAYLKERSEEADCIRRQIESQPGYAEWRERLLQKARDKGLVR